MKLEIQYTEADYREANANAFAQSTAKTRRNGCLAMAAVGFILILLLGFLWYLNRVVYKPPNSVAQDAEPAQDLMLILLPSSLMAIGFLVSSISMKIGVVQLTKKRTQFGKAAYARIKRGAAIAAVSFFLVSLAVLHGIDWLPVIPWRPDRMTAMLAGFAPWIIVVPVLGIVLRWYTRALVRARWEQKVSLHRPKVLEVSDNQVISSDVNTTGVFRWSAFVRFRETENLFILVTEDAGFLMVPKRYLAGPSVMVEFRGLLQSHIAEGYFLTVPQGAFPVVNAVSLPPPPLADR